jgi:SAM-dependent methyltransferase
MSESWEWDETLYAQSAGYYVRGRLPYPSQLAAQIVSAVGLGSDSRALDVGCGPGSMTLPLARLVGQIVGIDADEGMIAQARLAADQARIDNVAWRCVRGEQLPADLGKFDLATFAQSLHWMKRIEVLGLVRTMLVAGGACVHVHATTDRGDEADVYRAAGFDGPEQFTVPRGEVTERSIDQVVAATYSLSSSTPHLFADRRAEFQAELRTLLQDASDADDLFCERARDIEFDVWRPRQHPS